MKRVLLKLSGEALAGDKKTGFDEATVLGIAAQVKELVEEGMQIAVVTGGGNFWRGRSSRNIDRTKADQIGMLATVMNCIYVSEIFRSQGLKTRVMTPFQCGDAAQLFSKDAAVGALEEGEVVFLPAVRDIRTFRQIRQRCFARLRSRQIRFFWRSQSTESMMTIRRIIPTPASMRRFPLTR